MLPNKISGINPFVDPHYRLQNLYSIIDKKSQLSRFVPNYVQQLINQNQSRRKLILKARQFGVTTNEVLKRFDSVVWNRNRTACILAHKREVLDKIFDIVRVAYHSMPEQFRPSLDRGGGSKYEMRFPKINSKIYITLEVRGGTIHELHVSEAAFIPRERITATLQAVPPDGIVTFESTPNGLNDFYDLWIDKNTDYAKLFFPWFFHSEYSLDTVRLKYTEDEKYLIEQSKKNYQVDLTNSQICFRRFKLNEFKNRLGEFLQEYPEDDQTCFLSSGSNPFDTSLIKRKLDLCKPPIEEKFGIKIYKPLDKNKSYVIGCDPAEGVKRDFSVASCFCIQDREEVAFFRGQSNPSDFAEIIYKLGKLYSQAHYFPLAIVERNNHGHAVILKLRETLRYPNLWLDTDEMIGHRTTAITRPLLLDSFIDAVNSNQFTLNSSETLGECLTLVDNNGKIEAEEGRHDDCVIASALAIKVALLQLTKVKIYQNIENMIMV